ncbi:MAG: hypothetical protein JWM57_3434 [Phycisphaerales bacterium]|nr:hypothetical protein [Phycisphaerales bacterium]
MLLQVSLIATWYMVGLVWFVQAVAYPQFARVAIADFLAYHKAHTTFTSFVVLPPMFMELGTAIALVCYSPHDRGYQIALGLVIVCWINTFGMAIPAHAKLTRGHDAAVIRRLIRVNWIRTVAWTARGLLLLWKSGN